MSTADLAAVSRYIPAEGFSETIPETDKLLQIGIKAFEALFKSGKKIDLKVIEIQSQVFGDTAVVTGKRVGSITPPGVTAVEGQVAFSMIWSHSDGRWLVRHLHLSALPAAK